MCRRPASLFMKSTGAGGPRTLSETSVKTGDDLIGHGASSGHASTVDCAPGGLVLISSAFPKNGPAGTNPYLVQRRFYRSRPGALVLARTEIEERPYDAYAKDAWEFRSRAFQHCRIDISALPHREEWQRS